MSTPAPLPSRARIVVVGGGVIGCSLAYHLALQAESDVVLLERDRLTSGTTWHAAGLMTCFGSLSEMSTRMRLYSRDLYARLEAETGLSSGFRPVGLIEAAATDVRLEEYRRVAAFQRRLGLEVEEISPAEIAQRFPLARTDDLLAGFWVPGDGRVNPVDLTMSLARGARQRGVTVVEGCSVTSVVTQPDGRLERVTGVRTPQGDIECETVIMATGMWTRELAQRSGVVVPNQAAEHYYLVTDTIDGIDPDGPIFEDPAAYGYYREEGGGLMVGLFEPVAAAWMPDGIPEHSSFRTLVPDWDRMAPFLERAMDRVPVSREVGVRTFFCGPESFTPDLAPAVGEAPGIRGYWVVAGLNSVGVLSAGGLGRVVAHWVLTGRPDADVTGVLLDRFRPWQLDRDYRVERTSEILGTVYAAHPPGTQLRSARGRLRSPVHDEMVAAGACLRDVSGWESADWYAGAGLSPHATPSWGREPWFVRWEAEHRAVREAAGLMDLSFMTKLRVTGPDAAALLDWVSAGSVAGEEGRITYTQWLADDGGIEADLTVTRLGAEDFLVVASDTAYGHVVGWLDRHVGDADVVVEDVTQAWGMVTLQGPLSRDVLVREAPGADLTSEAFPYRGARWLEVAGVRCLVVRITYLGELGYELYAPAGDVPGVWRALLNHGPDLGLRPVGLRALSSLRLEKGYRDWGHDIDNTDDVVGAGLAFAVDLTPGRRFVGRAAVEAARARGVPAHRLVHVRLLDPEPLLWHGEVLLCDGVPMGDVRAGSYGWSVGGAVGLGFVEAPEPATNAWLKAGRWTVDVAGRQWAAEVSLRPFYDPMGTRIRV